MLDELTTQMLAVVIAGMKKSATEQQVGTIARAAQIITSGGCRFDAEDQRWVIPSQDGTTRTYRTTETTCECKAAEFRTTCKHRYAVRILNRINLAKAGMRYASTGDEAGVSWVKRDAEHHPHIWFMPWGGQARELATEEELLTFGLGAWVELDVAHV